MVTIPKIISFTQADTDYRQAEAIMAKALQEKRASADYRNGAGDALEPVAAEPIDRGRSEVHSIRVDPKRASSVWHPAAPSPCPGRQGDDCGIQGDILPAVTPV
jgi:hypothetical protein